MSKIVYEVRVYDNGDKFWYLDGKLHREDGPACEYFAGRKFWYLDGKELSEEEFNKEMTPDTPDTCACNTVEIDGIEYKLVKVK